MASLPKAERKYLQNEAEPEARNYSSIPSDSYGNVVVIPAMGETESLLVALDSIPESPLGRVLAIVVLNAREDADTPVHEANAWARERLGGFARTAFDVWVIDRALPGRFLPKGEGVGLARKIGTDLAAALSWDGRVRSRFLHGTDADVRLPVDYFEQSNVHETPEGGKTESALLYRFTHEPSPDPETARAILLYEVYLRYYVLGLRYAGSPYAVQTIGSTFAVDASAYAKVRGFPKRLAAEDFYLINKLAKVGKIRNLRGDRIVLEGRESERVPFGTGRAVRDILERKETESTYRLPHPGVFEALREALLALEEIAKGPPRAFDTPGASVDDHLHLRHLRAGEREPDLGGPATDAAHRAKLWRSALAAIGVRSFLQKLSREALDTAQRWQRTVEWFDAFRTLKFLHWVRDHGLAPVPLAEALDQSPFLEDIERGREGDRGSGDLRSQLLHLRQMEEMEERTADR